MTQKYESHPFAINLLKNSSHLGILTDTVYRFLQFVKMLLRESVSCAVLKAHEKQQKSSE